MSAEYWLVSQAVPYFTQRLAARHEVNLCHGARMFQLLFAGGWEPTKVHYERIPDSIWDYYERQAVSKQIPHISYELFPLCTRLPDKRSLPVEPEDSMIPVAFRVGERRFIVPMICTIEERNNGCYYLDIKFDHENVDGPYLNNKGESFDEEFKCGGEKLLEFLVEPLPNEPIETDFDDALREFVFDRLSLRALQQGSESLYRAWEAYLVQYEQDQIIEGQCSDAIRQLRSQLVNDPQGRDAFNFELESFEDMLEAELPHLPVNDRCARIVRHMRLYMEQQLGHRSSHVPEMPMHQSV